MLTKLHNLWLDISQEWTKDGLAIALLVSILFNMGQAADRGNLQEALNMALEENSSYRQLFDQAEEENHELLDVMNHIKEKNPNLPPLVQEEWARAFIEAGNTENLNPKLLIAVADVESRMFQVTPEGFDLITCSRAGQTVASCAGARGVMQVMPFWARACPYSDSRESLRHATINIRCGAYILAHYRDMFGGDMRLALIAYNRGERPVIRALRAGTDPANGYAKKVLERAKGYMEA